MATKQLSLHCKAWTLLSLATGAVLMASCAQDGFDDEEFDSGVYNTQLEAPSADDIKITPSTDGAMQTISGPLVYGAGGYHAILTDTDNGEVVKDTLIDGVSFATKRAEDTNYKISLAVLDNKEKNNKGIIMRIIIILTIKINNNYLLNNRKKIIERRVIWHISLSQV